MKRMLVAITVSTIGLLTPLAANAQFPQLGGLLGGSKSEAKPSHDVDGFLRTADEADELVRKSSDALFKAVATKAEIDAQEDKIKAANAIQDPKEREAALKQASDDQQAQLAKADFAAANAAISKEKDAKKKAHTSAAAYNFTLGMLKDREVLEIGQSLISSMSGNPMALLKLGRVKDVVSSLSGQMSNISTIAAGVQKMSSVVSVSALPTKSSDKPKPMAD